MRRGYVILSICALLIAGSALLANAGIRIITTADGRTPGMLVSMSVQDAEINAVIAALFNATENRYQARIGNGITGMIDELDLEQVTFDSALNSVLKKVNDEYSFTKLSASVYQIKAPAEPVMAPLVVHFLPEKKDDTVRMIKTMLPPMKTTTAATPVVPALPGEEIIPEEEPAAEECILAVVRIRYIDVPSLCDALGYQFMEAFRNDDRGGSRGGSRSNRNRTNDPYYDDRYYDDRYNDPNDPNYDPYYNDRYNNPNDPYYNDRNRTDPYYDDRYRDNRTNPPVRYDSNGRAIL